jgi:uncharacterized cupin superfamily protein
MTRPIINIADVELMQRPPAFAPTGAAAQRYEASMGLVSARIGAKKLGYNVTVVPPGKRAFPFHSHRTNEEMFFVIQGGGELRMGENTYSIGTGDFIACPPGGSETAHQIINTGKEQVRRDCRIHQRRWRARYISLRWT